MDKKSQIYTAGNILAPIYHLIIEKGYDVKKEGEYLIAENEISKFGAEDIVQLAGLVFLFESKGDNWSVSDEKIEEYLAKFY